jgi:hypothetical protein
VKDFIYTSKGTKLRNVYRDDDRLVVRREAVFPDICIGCGKPAWGNVMHKEFSGLSVWFVLPTGLGVVANSIFGKRYHFDVPFCASCPPDRLQLREVRLDTRLAIFTARKNAFPSTFLDSLPPVPPDIAAEAKRTRLQRTFRWLYS